MNVENIERLALADRLIAHTGRFTDKNFSIGMPFPLTADLTSLPGLRCVMSEQADHRKWVDTSTLKADNFTVSLIYKEPGRYAACHSHEIEESFLIIDGAFDRRLGKGRRSRRGQSRPQGYDPECP